MTLKVLDSTARCPHCGAFAAFYPRGESNKDEEWLFKDHPQFLVCVNPRCKHPGWYSYLEKYVRACAAQVGIYSRIDFLLKEVQGRTTLPFTELKQFRSVIPDNLGTLRDVMNNDLPKLRFFGFIMTLEESLEALIDILDATPEIGTPVWKGFSDGGKNNADWPTIVGKEVQKRKRNARKTKGMKIVVPGKEEKA